MFEKKNVRSFNKIRNARSKKTLADLELLKMDIIKLLNNTII